MTEPNAGFHHFHIGEVTVTALNDGLFEGSVGMAAGVGADEAEAMLRESFRPVPPRLTVNAFLIRSGETVALVDTGTGTLFGESLGRLPARLAAIGVAPEAIGTVLMTHLHIDHLGGLADAAGTPAFPNATLLLSEAEAGWWLDEANAAAAPEAAKNSFAVAARMTEAYRGRMELASGGEVLPGVTLMPLPGHTPGHSGYLIASGDQSLLIWGDIVHLPALQFRRPDIGMMFDTDLAQARTTRERAFDMAATDKVLVAGMHLEFPALGHVTRSGAGYAFVPQLWEAA